MKTSVQGTVFIMLVWETPLLKSTAGTPPTTFCFSLSRELVKEPNNEKRLYCFKLQREAFLPQTDPMKWAKEGSKVKGS